ncbi:hypothetical protein MY11210_004932 [Beauveria gryllotalpidicola]
MPTPTSPRELIPDECLSKLTGFDNWHTWHMKSRMALQKMGLRYLLNDDDPKDWDVPDAARQHESDQAAGVRLLVDGLSEDMLARAYAGGWKPERATVPGTLHTLEAIIDEEERRRREDAETTAAARTHLVGLVRADLAAGAQTVKEYILAAKHCHDGLLARYGGDGDSAGPVEELLEQLFVTALVEGLATSKPAWYAEWMEKLEQGTLARLGTRAGVTEWLLAKERDDSKLIAQPPPRRVAIVAQAARGDRAANRAEPAHRAQNACSYCAEHHRRALPHDESNCWFLKPHMAPRTWQDRYKHEVEAIKGRRGKDKRNRCQRNANLRLSCAAMTRHYGDPSRKIIQLRGHGSWKKWHKAVLVQLDMIGLRHLLNADLRPMSGAEQYQYAWDQKRAVQLLVANMSEQVLERLWNSGWEIPGATLKNTLALLADLLAEPERHPQQSYETHRDIVDLTRIDLAPASNGLDQYFKDAQQCHLRLLARYGGENGSVEELLEHLFTSSVMEGLKAAQPANYTQWMHELDRETRSKFVTQLVSLVKSPCLDSSGRQGGDAALAGVPRRPRDWERKQWQRRRARRAAKRSRAAWGLPPYVPYHKRYRGTDYPDCYQPRYDGTTEEVKSHGGSYTVDEIL